MDVVKRPHRVNTGRYAFWNVQFPRLSFFGGMNILEYLHTRHIPLRFYVSL